MAHSKRSDAADEWWIDHPDLTSGYNINFYWAAETATEYVTVDGTNVTVVTCWDEPCTGTNVMTNTVPIE